MNRIIVSVICNAYNHEKYIRKTLEGIVVQKTNFDFEVLIHDDASNDSTADIIREYEAKYPNIIKAIYETENQYSKHDGSLRKIQYGRVKGKYIAFCEGDDYWIDEYKLQKQVDFLNEHPDYTLCVTSSIVNNLASNKKVDTMIIKKDKDIDVKKIIKEENGRFFQFASTMFRKEIVLNIPQWRLYFPVGDIALFINAGINGKIRMLSDVTSVYNCGTSSSWTLNVLQNKEKSITFFKNFYKAFEIFNKETNFIYDDEVKYRLAVIQSNIDEYNGNFKAVYLNKKVWSKYSLKRKLWIIFEWKFPKIMRFYINLKEGKYANK